MSNKLCIDFKKNFFWLALIAPLLFLKMSQELFCKRPLCKQKFNRKDFLVIISKVLLKKV